MQKKRLVVGISGASGAPIAVEVLRQLRAIEMVESHLMITKGGLMTLRQETGLSPEELAGLADVFYENGCGSGIGFLCYGGDAGGTLLHEDRGRDRVGLQRQPAVKSGGCDVEGAQKAGPGGERVTAQFHPSEEYV